MHGPSNYQVSQCSIQRVLRVYAVEAMVTIAATRDQIGGLEFCELILDGLKREKTQACQLADIKLLPRIREQQTEDLRTDRWKQSMQQRFAHSGSRITRPLKAVEDFLRRELSIRRGRARAGRSLMTGGGLETPKSRRQPRGLGALIRRCAESRAGGNREAASRLRSATARQARCAEVGQ